MTEQYLMGRGHATMNVKPDKLQEYLADGWKVLKAPDENKHVVVDQPVVEIPELPEVPEAPKVEADPEPESLEDVVEKIGKKSRRGRKA